MGAKKTKAKLNREQVLHEVPINQAMAMYHEGFAEISTGEIKLTPAGRKKLGAAAVGVRMVIAGMS